MGRPQQYNEELAKRICQKIACGESLRSICANQDMPARGTVIRWVLTKDNKGFRDQFDAACQGRAELWAEELVDLADATDPGEVQKAKLKIETRKWVMSKLLAQRYGDKLEVKQTGKVEHDHTLDLSQYTPAEREELLRGQQLLRRQQHQNN